MYKLLPVLALSLLAAACVPHDDDGRLVDPAFQSEVYWEKVKEKPQPQPQPEPVYVQPVQVQPVQARPVQVQPVVVQEPPKQTWWQQNKQKHVVKVVTPTCPCKDPNDPCTHCYQK